MISYVLMAVLGAVIGFSIATIIYANDSNIS